MRYLRIYFHLCPHVGYTVDFFQNTFYCIISFTGQVALAASNVCCGQFTEAFIEALRVTYRTDPSFPLFIHRKQSAYDIRHCLFPFSISDNIPLYQYHIQTDLFMGHRILSALIVMLFSGMARGLNRHHAKEHQELYTTGVVEVARSAFHHFFLVQSL